MSNSMLPVFSPNRFMVSGLTFKYLTHFEFNAEGTLVGRAGPAHGWLWDLVALDCYGYPGRLGSPQW